MSGFMKYCAGYMQGMGFVTMFTLNVVLGGVFIGLGVLILVLTKVDE